MNFSFKRGGACCAVPRAVSALVVALGMATGHAQAVTVTTYNTGSATPSTAPVVLAPGVVDPNYTRVVLPGGTTGGTLLGAADVLAPIFNWLPFNGASAWIKPQLNFDGSVPPVFGTSYYQTKFDLTGLNPSTAAFAGQWATDNKGGRIFLNGQDLLTIGGSYGLSVENAWDNFSFSGANPLTASWLGGGLNYLTFRVDHLPSAVIATGLRVEYGGQALPVPEPASYALFGLGLAAITLLRRRVTA